MVLTKGFTLSRHLWQRPPISFPKALLHGNLATAGTFQSSVRVQCFTSYSQITVAQWPAALEVDDVLVMTPKSLVNMLNAGVVDFSKISLLVS